MGCDPFKLRDDCGKCGRCARIRHIEVDDVAGDGALVEEPRVEVETVLLQVIDNALHEQPAVTVDVGPGVEIGPFLARRRRTSGSSDRVDNHAPDRS